jgi:hypothetical protein
MCVLCNITKGYWDISIALQLQFEYVIFIVCILKGYDKG